MNRRPLFVERMEERRLLTTGTVDYVIAISVDGLRSDTVTDLGPTRLPNFFRLRDEGAHTDNARTDPDYTVTIPNHVSEVTGRPVSATSRAHAVTTNIDPGGTIHDLRGSYVASVFDVAHDHGLSTGLYASKEKFALLDRTWNEENGAEDDVGEDNGRDKIDTYLYRSDTSSLVAEYINVMASEPYDFSLLHLRDPDSWGHTSGWLSENYNLAVEYVDRILGVVLDTIENSSTLAGNTLLIVTSDHGGEGPTHLDEMLPENYTIPFFTWGHGVQPGGDLYALNLESRTDPGTAQTPANAVEQPIRNGDLANLSLAALGLPAIADSTWNAQQDLALSAEIVDNLPWQNSVNIYDVTDDGIVTARDVLLIVNELNGTGARVLSQQDGGGPPYWDVTGDGWVTARDVLFVVNELNRPTQSPASQGEGEQEAVAEGLDVALAEVHDWRNWFADQVTKS